MRMLIAAAVAACLLAGAATAYAATRTVAVGDNWFGKANTKPTVDVRRGDTVVWRWRGDSRHSVTVQRGPQRFNSGIKASGTYRRTLRRAGTYRIFCIVHPVEQRMTLRVR